jgi:predicted DCC family thiol-disulfide oxidoreductase YuxK
VKVVKEQTALQKAAGREVILFDGVCNLCSEAVDFILERDPEAKFAFASLQSDAGQEILSHFGLSSDSFDSMVLVKNGRVYQKSAAALEIAAGLHGAWLLMQVFKIVPDFIRNSVYDFIARNRYRFFGKRETCRFPTPDIRSRFLEDL